MSEVNLPRVNWIDERVPYGQREWDRDAAYFRSREFSTRSLQTFIPQIWAESLTRSLIQSLSYAEVAALCVQYEQEKRTKRLKRRNTLTRRRRRAAMKREKRTYRDANTKAGEG